MPEAATLSDFRDETRSALRNLGRAIIELSPFARGDDLIFDTEDPETLRVMEEEQQGFMGLMG